MGNEINPALVAAAGKRAAAEPLPGALSEAFLGDAIDVQGVKVRRIVASDWIILKGLNSPIYRQMLEFQKDEAQREPVPFTDGEAYEICWQFTHAPKASRELLARGREVFTETAREEIADLLDVAVCDAIVKAVGLQMVKSFQTAEMIADQKKS